MREIRTSDHRDHVKPAWRNLRQATTTFFTDEERFLSRTADGDVKTATAPGPAGVANAVPSFASLQPSALQGACSIAYFLLASSAATFVIKFLFTVHGFTYPALAPGFICGLRRPAPVRQSVVGPAPQKGEAQG